MNEFVILFVGSYPITNCRTYLRGFLIIVLLYLSCKYNITVIFMQFNFVFWCDDMASNMILLNDISHVHLYSSSPTGILRTHNVTSSQLA